ncbi:glutamate racemase [Salinivibrio sp. PR5]|uniref:glutamate racemase n=1 Tax=unclassified Salinivibrio TaxID=2636825 RepID=UPI000988AD7F|nr:MULTISPECIES: glutamate racemase [unclassified Salinivibrio]OOF09878.1 glutamate racemase [Salinivibrio sp. PR5]OOF22437.1 glutamate racemase [Salinivibrio sp. IB574]
MAQPHILIFDSGVGGLSVYQAIKASLPSAQYTYLFDNAAFPYGELEDQRLVHRVLTLIKATCERHAVDIIVIACNTASTLVLPTLRDALSIPVVGVVPAIKPAAALSQHKAIGLLATPATVSRPYTAQLIADFAKDCRIVSVGTTALVHMAERKLRGEAVNQQDLSAILAPFDSHIDVLVLGCTHFPLLHDEIQAAMGKQVQLVDSGSAIARRVASLVTPQASITSDNSDGNRAYATATPIKAAALSDYIRSIGLERVSYAPAFLDRSLHAL